MKASTFFIDDTIYEVKDANLRTDYKEQKNKFDEQVSDARFINDVVTEGKKQIAEAITSKNVITEPNDTFETMAAKVDKINYDVGYTTPSRSYVYPKTKYLKKFILEYPYRYFMDWRPSWISGNDRVNADLIYMECNYEIIKNIPSNVSVISRVKRLENDWTGVNIFSTFDKSYGYKSALQLVSNALLALCTGEDAKVNKILIQIPDISAWEELVVEFKHIQYLDNTIDISISIAQVIDDEIQDFVEIYFSHVDSFKWGFAESNYGDYTSALCYLGTQATLYDVAPSAVNMRDCAFVVNGFIHTGSTSLYPFPKDFTTS